MKTYKKIYIEITNVCNLACSFCPKTKRKPGFMSVDLFERILGQVRGKGKYIYFHIMGEPLLHPKLPVFLDLCHEYGFKVNITTNGTLVENAAELLLSKAALRQVNFSLHSFEANSVDFTMESYLDGIFSFIKRAQENKVVTCLRLWNLADRGRNDWNALILKHISEELKPGFTLQQELTPVKGIRLADYVFLNQAEVFDWPDLNAEEVGNVGFCYGLRDQLGFLVDGTVVPCCLDGEGIINLGNIMEEDFDSIIKGTRAVEMYNGFTGRVAAEELCRRCGYRTRFND
ncbi:MAG: radical SAM protein [Clostridiales bacterium]|nr:radical SAM protein [Clostridiales bacterium]